MIFHVERVGPGVTIQDLGRDGMLGQGISRSGAADGLALAEGAAILGQSRALACLEMAGFGGVFRAETDTRVALTGAPMRATIDGEAVAWNVSHLVPAGARLDIGAASSGTYGYLHVGGGFEAPEFGGSRSTHLTAGIGRAVAEGDVLTSGPDGRSDVGLTLRPAARFEGGTVRIIPSMQTELFTAHDIERFQNTNFARDMRANRMGVRLNPDTGPFAAQNQLNILSEIIVPGDIQMTGDGAPFVLIPECETTGGYPRIGTVIPADLPIVAQATAGAILRFSMITLEAAVTAQRGFEKMIADLRSGVKPLIRDPKKMNNLLEFQLVSGVVSAKHDPFEGGKP